MNPICTYGIDDKPMVNGICFSCDDIDMLLLYHFSHIPCHEHLASNMHCLPCCPFSPYYASDIAQEETPIVSSYLLGNFDTPYDLHDFHVESIRCDAMLHRISCDNSLGHIMFDNPLDLS